jgi:hypothetical protein
MFFWDSIDSHNKGMEVALGYYYFAFNLMPFAFVFHFPTDVKKPDSFESGFLVFGAW